jgi:hypothetical protein
LLHTLKRAEDFPYISNVSMAVEVLRKAAFIE